MFAPARSRRLIPGTVGLWWWIRPGPARAALLPAGPAARPDARQY